MYTISSSVLWTHLSPESRTATSRVSGDKKTKVSRWCLTKRIVLNVDGTAIPNISFIVFFACIFRSFSFLFNKLLRKLFVTCSNFSLFFLQLYSSSLKNDREETKTTWYAKLFKMAVLAICSYQVLLSLEDSLPVVHPFLCCVLLIVCCNTNCNSLLNHADNFEQIAYK